VHWCIGALAHWVKAAVKCVQGGEVSIDRPGRVQERVKG